ncbi:hypothetical protein [Elizabethkingia anophelis]|uniref:hypothetical protein n=1 Tax=Elizabethkingia anophelis TaxID=1117645 RepID=UPI0038913302
MKKRTTPTTDKVIFYENEIPDLQAGTYTLEATLEFDKLDEKVTSQQKIVVESPQTGVNPSEIHAMLPAMNAVDHFEYILPSIVLNNPKLPWERKLNTDTSAVTPWMALLVFTEDELYWDSVNSSPILQCTVTDFQKPEDGIYKPNIVLSDSGKEQINTIRISVETARNILPGIEELSLLTHVRTTSSKGQVLENGTGDNTFAVIMANRMAIMSSEKSIKGVRNYVFLVSLEGWEEQLENNFKNCKSTDSLKIISLTNWSFTTISEPSLNILPVNADPTKRMEELNLLRIPIEDNGTPVVKKILSGYTAIGSEMIDGSKSFAWYRGPLSAVPYKKLPENILPCYHSDSAKIYLQKDGVFDHSYSAAWSLGQLMGLSDPLYTENLQSLIQKTRRFSIQLKQRSELNFFSNRTDSRSLRMTNGLGKEIFFEQLKNRTVQNTLEKLKQPLLEKVDDQKQKRNRQGVHPFTTKEITNFLNKDILKDTIIKESEEILNKISHWLAKTALLYNVPFQYLVPDQRMLPVESARFFYIDKGWLTMLIEGAIQLGINSTLDKKISEIIYPEIKRKLWLKTTGIRQHFFNEKQSDSEFSSIPVVGMLIRSAYISQAKTPVIEAMFQNTSVEPLRADKLSSDVLIVLWDKIPDTVSITYPEQNWFYGLTEHKKIMLSSIKDDNKFGSPLQKEFPHDDFSKFLRKDTNGVINNVINFYSKGSTVKSLALEIKNELNMQSINGPQLALQLKKHARKIIYK